MDPSVRTLVGPQTRKRSQASILKLLPELQRAILMAHANGEALPQFDLENWKAEALEDT